MSIVWLLSSVCVFPLLHLHVLGVCSLLSLNLAYLAGQFEFCHAMPRTCGACPFPNLQALSTCTCTWYFLLKAHPCGDHYHLICMQPYLVLITSVLPTLVGSGRPQPPLSLFYHHWSIFCHHSQRVNMLKSKLKCKLVIFLLKPNHHSDHPGQNPA